MRILHLCLAAFYIDNSSYQENILPRMHKKMGHEIKIVASTETFVDHKRLGYVKPSSYINSDGIPVKRIPYVSWIPSKLVHKLRIYKNVFGELEEYVPDLIFIHNPQFLSILSVRKYIMKHPSIKVVVDGHSDFYNSARTFFSYRILHRIVYRYCTRAIMPFSKAFYGTLPAREKFFIDVYGVPKSKVSLLHMGGDDEVIYSINKEKKDIAIRRQYNIKENDFLIVTGGKLNHSRPETLSLLKAVVELKRPDIKIIFFGNVADEYAEIFAEICESPYVINVGWQPTEKTYEYMAAGDLVVFPGLHSVMWEQAVALGKPCIFRKLEGFSHIDIGGNAIFLEDVSTEGILDVLKTVIDKNGDTYKKMKEVSSGTRKEEFLYSKIAERSINV